MSTKVVAVEELECRIHSMKHFIEEAQACLDDNDFLQCAVRLEMAASQGKFDDFMMQIFEAVTEAK